MVMHEYPWLRGARAGCKRVHPTTTREHGSRHSLQDTASLAQTPSCTIIPTVPITTRSKESQAGVMDNLEELGMRKGYAPASATGMLQRVAL
jgi:hypothetical protein